MSESIRALIVILVLSGAVLFAVRPALIQMIPATTFDRWRRLWFITTLAWFLANSFWIYVLVMGVVLTVARKKESHVFGLYLLLILAIPSIPVAIPGFGIIDHLFMLDHHRLLALLLLLPAALRLMRDNTTPKFGRSPVDWMVLGYLTLTCVLSMLETSLTNAVRMILLQYIDGILPYYVASRSIKSTTDFRGVLAGFLMGALVLSVLAVFEVARSWKIYQTSVSDLGLFVHQNYKMRGPFLRPGAALMDSIALGLVVVFAIGVLLYLKDLVTGRIRLLMLWGILLAGLLASLSRAPWVGAVMLILLYVFQGEKAIGRMTKVLAALFVSLTLLNFFPAGQEIIDLIPIIGESEQGSIEYRANWFSASLPLIERNFWFGDVQVLQAPELEVMRQGEGIIDLVNLFLSVLLLYGSVTLFFFVGMFVRALWLVWRSERISRKLSPELSRLGRALISIVIALMFIIFTLSAISVVPILILTSVGLCSAYGFLVDSERRKSLPSKANMPIRNTSPPLAHQVPR